MKATFKLLFFVQKTKMKADGTAPILARVTVNGDMVTFSTQKSVKPDRWDSKAQRTPGRNQEEKDINSALDKIQTSAQNAYYDILAIGMDVTPDRIKMRAMGTEEKVPHSFMELSNMFIKDYKELVLAQGSGKETLFRYQVVQNRVVEFMKAEYKVTDMPLDGIDKRFLDKFYLWLRSTHNNANNTAVKLLQKMASIFKMGRDNGWIHKNPFAQIKLHLDPVDRSYLTKEEIEKVYNKQFTSKRLEAVRDMFIFCCYTGLAYIDLKQLTEEEIIEKQDGRKWIVTHRQKTKTNVNVPLLDIPLMLLEKYKGQGKNGHVFPVLSNQKMNDYIKEIIAICDIDKDITCHSARHTFATTVTLENGVPIESVSKMLGHTNIKTTQIYARITDQKIAGDMDNLAAKIGGQHPTPPEPSAMSKGITVKARRQAVEIPTFRMVSGL